MPLETTPPQSFDAPMPLIHTPPPDPHPPPSQPAISQYILKAHSHRLNNVYMLTLTMKE